MSRTPAVAGAAVALAQGRPLAEGLEFVTKAGPADVSPALWAEIEAALGQGGAAAITP
jgi:hypothetical protein